MPSDPRVPFPYMRWAKAHLTEYGANNLGMSGLPALTAGDLAPEPVIAYWAPEGPHGDPGLREAVAKHEGVPAERVYATAGTSLANFLVFLAEARGGHVAVESPAYEALPRLPEAVGASVSTFRRVEDRGWRVDPDSLRAAVRPGTRLVAVTDLHNPSGVRLHADDLALLLAEAARVDATVLVDEVYRELDLVPRSTAALADPRVLVTNSLTKAHGLGGLRIGWILGAPERIERIARWNDLVCPAHPVPSIAVARAYLPRAPAFLERTRAWIGPARDRVAAWIASRRDVSWVLPDGGLTGFLRLPAGVDAERFAARARERHGVVVVPGSFFQSRDHVRISFGLPAEDLDRALAALGAALDDVRPR